MARIFEYLSYRKWIKEEAAEWKKARSGHTLNRLAQVTGVQPPYLTNVLKERAHLSSDQFFSLAKAFSLTDEELNYGLLLLEWERSALPARRQFLRAKVDLIRKEKLNTEAHLKAQVLNSTGDELARFYLNPDLQLIHAFLGIEKFAQNLNLIAESLHMRAEQVESLVKELSDLGFVKRSSKGIEKTQKRIHLSKSSPLCRPQQLLMHHRALQQLQLLPDSERYNFSVTFTAHEETRQKIHQEFLQFLSKIEKWVIEAPSHHVYQMHFDLFPWSRSEQRPPAPLTSA